MLPEAPILSLGPAARGERSSQVNAGSLPRSCSNCLLDLHQAAAGADLLRNPCGIRSRSSLPEKRETPGSTRESGGFGERRRSDVVVELELVRVRTKPHGVDILTLQLDPGLDQVRCEDIACEQIVVIGFQVVQHPVQAVRNRLH